jgi:hypothetical protein
MAIKESKRVNWNNKYENFVKHIEELTPTKTQENLAKEEKKRDWKTSNSVRFRSWCTKSYKKT